MARLRTTAALLACLPFIAAAPLHAAVDDDHVVSATEIQRALQQRTRADQQRATVLGLLQRAELRELLGGAGLDLRSAESAVRTLSGEELTRLADSAAALDRELVGGQNVTVNIVVLLLIIIIIILLVK
jgi:hypothetical protein